MFRAGGTRPPTEVMVSFIDAYRGQYGVESICATLPVAPSVYYEYKARQGGNAQWYRDVVRIPSSSEISSTSIA